MSPAVVTTFVFLFLSTLSNTSFGWVIPQAFPTAVATQKRATRLQAESQQTPGKKKKGRKILFITTDMMRWDSLGYYGDPYARTPYLDQLAKQGIRYDAARNQNPLCMPCRNSMIMGQYPRTHGSWNNGIPLPHDAPTIGPVLFNSHYNIWLRENHPEYADEYY